ncbi:hypothetical protein AAGW05_10410 [Arthrobacter sp. LAPM80]|uniref:hypothetical protein n=1 Tax=Arthrobacter sp. LAPM80 TaxID=3141788 RepID=UPI00398BAC0B
MSKETEPILSRRQLREKSAQAVGAAGTPPVPVRPAPKAAAVPGPVEPEAPDAESAAPAPAIAPRSEPGAPKGERESQTRARDRAALRAYKELIDPAGMSPLPSRRALRQAQIDAERAPITAVNPVVSATPVPPLNAPRTQPSPQVSARAEAGQSIEATLGAPKDQVPATTPAPAPRTRGARRSAAVTAAPSGAAPNGARQKPSSAPAVRDGIDAAAADAPAEAVQDAAAEEPGAKEATAAVYPPLPGLVPGGAYYPVSAGPPPAVVAPTTEELRDLAAQRAESERAAILAERAQARERLAQESAKNRRPAADPTATNNLAMVTPLDFIEVPGASRPVLRQPTTTHVPIVAKATGSGTSKRPATKRTPPARPPSTQAASGQSHGGSPASQDEPRATVPSVSAERFDAALASRAVHRPGPGNRTLTGGRSSTLLQAEAMATGGHPMLRPSTEPVEVQRSQMPPMPADYAHGLEPLDAMTAGLRRTQRNLLIQWGSIIVGGAALVVSAIVILTNLAR